MQIVWLLSVHNVLCNIINQIHGWRQTYVKAEVEVAVREEENGK